MNYRCDTSLDADGQTRIKIYRDTGVFVGQVLGVGGYALVETAQELIAADRLHVEANPVEDDAAWWRNFRSMCS